MAAVFREDYEAMLLAGAGRLTPRGNEGEPISITETAVQWAATMLLSRSFSLNLQTQVPNSLFSVLGCNGFRFFITLKVSVLTPSVGVMLQKLRPGSFAEDTIALVPWADMLNHSSSAGRESCLVYDQKSGVATLQAHRTYSEGEQVFDSYGPSCSPSRLLLDYGFVDEENTNHSVDLPVRRSSLSLCLYRKH